MEQQIAFDILKTTFTSVPILSHFDIDQYLIVETDPSHYVSVCVLFQYNYDNVLYPIAYISKKYSPVEYNYVIYIKELMAII
jgi:hypothetical protein